MAIGLAFYDESGNEFRLVSEKKPNLLISLPKTIFENDRMKFHLSNNGAGYISLREGGADIIFGLERIGQKVD